MSTTRRNFISAAALGGLGAAVSPILPFDYALPGGAPSVHVPGATGECMAASTGSFYRPYRSKSSGDPWVTTWMQIDLGSSQSIEAVKLYPFTKPHRPPGDGFPERFRIECSDDPTFDAKDPIADWSEADFPDPLGEQE